jgi:hypothetical protein
MKRNVANFGFELYHRGARFIDSAMGKVITPYSISGRLKQYCCLGDMTVNRIAKRESREHEYGKGVRI